LGGPYLEDFRLLYDFCPDISMVSIENDKQTYKRQEFHLPCGSLKLVLSGLQSFLAQYDAEDKKSIFWLDYTGLDYGAFEDFSLLLGKVADGSVIKVTLRAEPSDYVDADGGKEAEKRAKFRSEFAALLPTPTSEPPNDFELLASLLQDMLQIASQKAIPSGLGRCLIPLCSFCYADGVGMYTFTGIVCAEHDRDKYRERFKGWRFANLDWGPPMRIDVPFLSTKERLRLQEFLPCRRGAGNRLLKALGYIIDHDKKKSVVKLSQYAEFHRYYPYFVKAIP
jgi:hypothetical protein